MVASFQTSTIAPPLPQPEALIPSESWVDDLFNEIAVEAPATKVRKSRKTKAKPKKEKASQLNKVAPLALSLSRSDRFQLIEMLQQFNDWEAEEMAEEERAELIKQESSKRKLRKGRSAHVEFKIINGCGPYRYLRWWCGSVYKSTYIGK